MYFGIVHSNLPFFIQWLDSHVVKAGESKQMFSTCCHWNESAHGQLRNSEHCLKWWWCLVLYLYEPATKVPSLSLSGYAYYSTRKKIGDKNNMEFFEKISTHKEIYHKLNCIMETKGTKVQAYWHRSCLVWIYAHKS
jgi:hypothetical protein